jgi:hypothetical protein
VYQGLLRDKDGKLSDQRRMLAGFMAGTTEALMIVTPCEVGPWGGGGGGGACNAGLMCWWWWQRQGKGCKADDTPSRNATSAHRHSLICTQV